MAGALERISACPESCAGGHDSFHYIPRSSEGVEHRGRLQRTRSMNEQRRIAHCASLRLLQSEICALRTVEYAWAYKVANGQLSDAAAACADLSSEQCSCVLHQFFAGTFDGNVDVGAVNDVAGGEFHRYR